MARGPTPLPALYGSNVSRPFSGERRHNENSLIVHWYPYNWGSRMKRLTLPLLLVCFAAAGRAQLLPDQKLQDFQQLAALYAKQYAPYEWKRDMLKVDLLQLSPWLDKVRNTKSDIEFYEVCASYVTSLNDAHSQFFLPTDFQADLLFEVDLYDGKALIDFIDPSIGRSFTFRVGDELISVDGK